MTERKKVLCCLNELIEVEGEGIRLHELIKTLQGMATKHPGELLVLKPTSIEHNRFRESSPLWLYSERSETDEELLFRQEVEEERSRENKARREELYRKLKQEFEPEGA